MSSVPLNPAPASLLVQKAVVVSASQAHAFETFTQRMGRWWPLQSHHIGASDPQIAVIEPRVGGRWYERAADGAECDWGKVLVWDPPHRLVLTWSIGSDWKYDAKLHTEVEVRFVAETKERTRVELEHRRLGQYGANAPMMKSIFESERGWHGILQRYAEAVQGSR
jgi:uncharacterized protein YndB with AHSA1/START domain